ncbi:hypothetical protein [Nocardiopsis dassonvillei]|uniref:hypothetical protein n=1 Tax=Nocardiopsis dassonvillei TaxID=2014 RepID=UPI0036720F0A
MRIFNFLKRNKPTEQKLEKCRANEIIQKIESEKSEDSGFLIREHLGLILAFIPIALAVIRVMRASGMQSPNLQILIETLDVTKLLIFTLSEYGPIVIFYFYLFFLVKYYRTPPEKRSTAWTRALWKTLPTISVVLIFLIPPVGIAVLLGTAFFYWLLEYIAHRRKKPESARADLSSVATSLFVLLIISPDTIWITPREIETKNGDTEIGYILRTDNKEFTVMTEEAREIIVIPADSIEKTTPCSLSKRTPPIATYIFSDRMPKTNECKTPD